ncbi:unnamed protein product, partial [Prorocentrum cordatum]
MDLEAPSWALKRRADGSGTGGRPQRKTRKLADLAGSENLKSLAKLIAVLTRLALTGAAELRGLTGAEGITYRDRAQEAKKDPEKSEALGLPDPCIFMAALKALASLAEKLSETEKG